MLSPVQCTSATGYRCPFQTDDAGDQADVAMLNEIVEDAKLFSGYDIIVDDAGHKSDLMLSSLKVSILHAAQQCLAAYMWGICEEQPSP